MSKGLEALEELNNAVVCENSHNYEVCSNARAIIEKELKRLKEIDNGAYVPVHINRYNELCDKEKALEIIKEHWIYNDIGLIQIEPISMKNNGYKIDTKLGQLEDIEEELGIDLVTLFKALKDGIYVNEDYIDYGTTNNFLTSDNLDCDFELKQLNNGLFLKDYGKTWALTKEELL